MELPNPSKEQHYIIEQVNSKMVTRHVNEIFSTVATTSTSSLSADEEEYIKMLTGGIDDETLYGGTSYENEAKIEKEEANKVKGVPRVQSDDDVYFDEEVDHDSAPHPVEETNDDNDCSHDNDSEEEIPDDSDDDGYNGYGGYNEYGECDRGYYYRDGRYERKVSPMMSPIISPVTA